MLYNMSNGVLAVTSSSTGAKHKPVLDEAGFEELLAAAYVLQQHNDVLRTKISLPHQPDPADGLAQTLGRSFIPLEQDTPFAGRKDRAVRPTFGTPFTNADLTICRVCGRQFEADEEFCGGCGLPRAAEFPSQDLQGKWASLWYMQKAQDSPPPELPSPPPSLRKIEIGPVGRGAEYGSSSHIAAERLWATSVESLPVHQGSCGTADASPAASGKQSDDHINTMLSPQPWYAVLADGLLVRIKALPTLVLTTQSRHAGLAVTCAALVLSLIVWGLWPARSPAQSQLSWFQSLLVEVGMAEVPARVPSYSGNPEVRVWVDVHTALYYCTGSDLYGKTPGGRFSSQKTAQEDQFEPASRVACE